MYGLRKNVNCIWLTTAGLEETKVEVAGNNCRYDLDTIIRHDGESLNIEDAKFLLGWQRLDLDIGHAFASVDSLLDGHKGCRVQAIETLKLTDHLDCFILLLAAWTNITGSKIGMTYTTCNLPRT